jgi:hypothetical protein
MSYPFIACICVHTAMVPYISSLIFQISIWRLDSWGFLLTKFTWVDARLDTAVSGSTDAEIVVSLDLRVRNMYTIQNFNVLTLQIKEQLSKTIISSCIEYPYDSLTLLFRGGWYRVKVQK